MASRWCPDWRDCSAILMVSSSGGDGNNLAVITTDKLLLYLPFGIKLNSIISKWW